MDGEIRNISTPEDTAANVIRLRVDWPTVLPEAEMYLPADESPLRWERPRIVSTRASTAAGTPKPNGWEA